MNNLPKFLVRLTILFVAGYFMFTYILAQNGIEYFNDSYVVLLELCLCVFCSVQGNYHCKYIRYTAWALFISDTLTRLDNCYSFLSADMHNQIPIFLIASSICLSFYLSVRHFILVQILKHKKKSRYKEYGIRR